MHLDKVTKFIHEKVYNNYILKGEWSMSKKSMVRRLLSKMIVSVLIVVNMASGMSTQSQAAVETKESADTNSQLVNSIGNLLNSSEKYLYLGEQGVNTYNFNVKKEAQEAGATYSWYVKEDKGNPAAVSINKITGNVTAKEAGVAYIRCKVTYEDGTYLRPEAKITVRNNITEVQISNILENSTITAGEETNFNQKILDTAAGKGVKTLGITRWEIAEDSSGVENATTNGIVFPVK